jgi:hypothetical protein
MPEFKWNGSAPTVQDLNKQGVKQARKAGYVEGEMVVVLGEYQQGEQEQRETFLTAAKSFLVIPNLDKAVHGRISIHSSSYSPTVRH